MARVRYIGAEPVTVPELGDRTVQPDEMVEVPDARWEGYVGQTATWEAVDEPKADQPTTAPKKTTTAAKSATSRTEG